MAEVLVRYTTRIAGDDGVSYLPQACGGPADDGLWEGWIEFLKPDGTAVRTARETEQPKRADLFYWAEGLTDTYLQGALTRAVTPRTTVAPAARSEPSVFDGPANGRPRPPVATHAVLDPFAAFSQGEAILRRQLAALSRDHLINIVRAYRLDVPVSDDTMSDPGLADAIVTSVRHAQTASTRSEDQRTDQSHQAF
jgi:hypothetical protein